MWLLIKIMLFVLGFFVILNLSFLPLIRKFSNPYRLYMVFGKKGSGKTTYMCKLAIKYHKRGRQVYSNVELPFAKIFDVKLLGQYAPPPESVLLIDEVGMIWDNRDYKNFSTSVRDYFKLQRQYRNIVYLFSQTFDIDVKLRNLTDAMFLVTSPMACVSILRRIKRSIVLLQPTPESEGRISDSLEFVPLILNLFGFQAFQFTWVPRYSPYFKSFNPKPLQDLDGVSRSSLITTLKRPKKQKQKRISRLSKKKSA